MTLLQHLWEGRHLVLPLLSLAVDQPAQCRLAPAPPGRLGRELDVEPAALPVWDLTRSGPFLP